MAEEYQSINAMESFQVLAMDYLVVWTELGMLKWRRGFERGREKGDAK
jgi:hypothetical protein